MDIRDLCCRALDLMDIPWRTSNWEDHQRVPEEAVARLDELIGLKV